MAKEVDGVFIVVEGPTIFPGSNDGDPIVVAGRYQQKDQLHNGRFVYHRRFDGFDDPRHPNHDYQRYNPEFSCESEDVEILYDGEAWIMRRRYQSAGAGIVIKSPLAWSSPTTALHPPSGGWITKEGMNPQIRISLDEIPANKAITILDLHQLLGKSYTESELIALLYAEAKRAKMENEAIKKESSDKRRKRNLSPRRSVFPSA